ncbi:MAG: DAK2 domain-containing protein [Clostridia bacterium]|nr:DAK2 domain-containing protein [Clostridia bacterium]
MKITGEIFSRMIISAANNLGNSKEEVDRLNVFPVPDGDTGKNMYLTMSGAANAVKENVDPDFKAVANKVASATLKSARGNSGVILSQLFRGLAKGIETFSELDGKALAAGLEKASATAYKAVMKPTEGTILTVARACAESAVEAAENTDDLATVARAALEGGKIALDKTPDMLPKLKEAGVVDAGGMGWICIFEGMLKVMETGVMVEYTAEETGVSAGPDMVLEEEEITFGYCTEFIIEKSDFKASVNEFRNTISPLGDCMLVIEDFDVVKVHIHTDNPGLVLQAALKIGSLINIKIDNMRQQHNNTIAAAQEKAPRKEFAIIAVSAGTGFSDIFKQLGVTDIIEGGQTMNPSAGDIADAVNKANADVVYVLPNNSNIILAAEQARDIVDCKIEIIPTKTVPQGISAVIAFNPESSAEDNVRNMKDSASYVQTGLVTYAVRDSEANGIVIKEGNIIGLSDKTIVTAGEDINEAVLNVCESIADEDTGVITLYYGSDVSEDDANALFSQLEEKYEDCDVILQYGGQPVYYYMVSAE